MKITKHSIKLTVGIILTTGILTQLQTTAAVGERDRVINESKSNAIAQLSTEDLPSMSGYWKLRVSAYRDTALSGGMAREYELLLFLRQNNRRIEGNLVSASPSTICNQAEITGQIIGKDVTWVQNYNGLCCKNAQTKFTGKLNHTGFLEGKYFPVGTPPSGCTLWWANVTGTKRE